MVFATGLLNCLLCNEGRVCRMRRPNWRPFLFRHVTEIPTWT